MEDAVGLLHFSNEWNGVTMNHEELSIDVLHAWEDLPFVESLDGVRGCIIEVDPAGDAEGSCVVALNYAPGVEVAPHCHIYGHIEIVLSGTLYVGDRPEPPGTIRIVPRNCTYGTLQSKDGRCRVLEVFPVMYGDAAGGRYSPEVLAQYEFSLEELNRMRSSVGRV
jgi:hypothetical protein